MFEAATQAEEMEDKKDYGFKVTLNEPFDWKYVCAHF
jgi:hypothetical protein